MLTHWAPVKAPIRTQRPSEQIAKLSNLIKRPPEIFRFYPVRLPRPVGYLVTLGIIATIEGFVKPKLLKVGFFERIGNSLNILEATYIIML
jgi:hypothetical protein